MEIQKVKVVYVLLEVDHFIIYLKLPEVLT